MRPCFTPPFLRTHCLKATDPPSSHRWLFVCPVIEYGKCGSAPPQNIASAPKTFGFAECLNGGQTPTSA